MIRTTSVFVAVAAALALSGSPATVGQAHGASSGFGISSPTSLDGGFRWHGVDELSITEVHVDFDNERMVVAGRGFDSGRRRSLSVELGELGLITDYCVVDLISDPQVIDCDFSSTGLPADGSYLLTVTVYWGEGKRNDEDDARVYSSDELHVTIGAVGPRGEQGPQGDTGLPGVAGLQGDSGADGSHCWDLNGNGIGDSDEDANADAQFSAADCAGPMGEQGPQGDTGPQGLAGLHGDSGADGSHCWDLNGNGIGDPEEDANGDDQFSVADCAGPQGEQGLKGDTGAQGLKGDKGDKGNSGSGGTIPGPRPPLEPSVTG